MRFTPGLRAITLATVVALSGVSALSAPVAAADPVPAPDPVATVSTSPTGLGTIDPTPSPTPTVPSKSPSLVPALALTTIATPAAQPHLGARVVRIAMAQRHKRYVYGATGPSAFDCSGLVRFAYQKAGVSRSLGGGHSAWAMYHWGLRHHLTSRSHPRVGDVVVYGRGTHVGIYIGHGLVVSALNPRQGIRVTRLHALSSPFTTFIHTGL